MFNLTVSYSSTRQAIVERWDVFELVFKGPSSGNPFLEVSLSATFSHDSVQLKVNGFYDGDGVYRIRFMPGQTGEWNFVTQSNIQKMDKQKGKFNCVNETGQNRGIVQVANTFHFKYSDGTPYFPIGTTAYKWHHQNDSLISRTLKTLKSSPFNKIRMCVLPFQYVGAMEGPRSFPYEGTPPKQWDFERFNPVYFQELDKAVLALRNLGIEADLILFHSYDYTWGIRNADEATQMKYLDYLIARIAAYRNVWWSMANEHDLLKWRTDDDWDRYFKYLHANDPYNHLRSIHNGGRWYNHSKPWITHLSIQHQIIEEVVKFRDQYQKPVLIDECGYEGNYPFISGNLSPQELVQRFWHGYSRGCYVTHGESFITEDNISFWAHGGTFIGETVPRLEILKKIVDNFPKDGISPPEKGYWKSRGGSFSEPDYYLYYLAYQQPAYIEVELPENFRYEVKIIDTWNMTILKYPKTVSGKSKIELPGKTHMAVVCRKIEN